MVTFAPDESVQIVNVTVVNDDILENTEMFTAMLTATPGSMVMIGAADTATATIIDDDSKPSFIELCANQTRYTTVCGMGMRPCPPSLVTVQCCNVYTIKIDLYMCIRDGMFLPPQWCRLRLIQLSTL